MDEYVLAKSDRKAKVQGHLDSWNKTAKILEEEWKKIAEGHAELEAKKETLATQNGGSDINDSDILDINSGGQIIRVTRGTLTQVKGSRLEAIFSGRWEKQLQRDSKGRIFLDVNPSCFKTIVDYLNECKIAPPDNPPNLPHTDPENKLFLNALLTAFGLNSNYHLDSEILTDPNHLRALTCFLGEDNIGSGLSLLYRGSRDGMSAAAFHEKCDNQGPTITVVKSTENYIFGGFSDKDWGSKRGWTQSTQAFLFGLFCNGGQHPVKMKLMGNKNDRAMYCNRGYGPLFGSGHDLALFDTVVTYSNLGESFVIPQGGTRYYFTGEKYFGCSEIEVFKVDDCMNQPIPLPPPPKTQAQEWHNITFDKFPDDLQRSFQAEKEALMKATVELTQLQDSFEKEQKAVQIFCSGDDDEIALMNVSGHTMAVRHSTLAKYPDSVLYKQFADTTWNGKRKRNASPREWDKKEVVAWSQKISGLSEEVDQYFRNITGAELLVMGREDIMYLGIKHPGTIALIVDAIQSLQKEEEESFATFIEHSEYCFGKIIDHMRLKAMSTLDIVGDPKPPVIREPDQNRFKRIVEYYFPTEESASQFLIATSENHND